MTDGQLLDRFSVHRDEAAFDHLVRRHGPMVLGVCRRVLGNPHDAEDAFQATFLVLLRRAPSIAAPDLLGNWLYGVAYRTALEMRGKNARRQEREKPVENVPDPGAPAESPWRHLLPVLDQELNSLAEKYRIPVVLCELEGRSRKEVAAQLCLAEGTLSSRLASARKMLAQRLTRRGVAITGAALAAVLAEQQAAAAVPATLVTATVKAALPVTAATSTAVGGGLAVVQATAITGGGLPVLISTKLKVATVLCLGLGTTGVMVGQSEQSALAVDPPGIVSMMDEVPPNGPADFPDPARQPVVAKADIEIEAQGAVEGKGAAKAMDGIAKGAAKAMDGIAKGKGGGKGMDGIAKGLEGAAKGLNNGLPNGAAKALEKAMGKGAAADKGKGPGMGLIKGGGKGKK